MNQHFSMLPSCQEMVPSHIVSLIEHFSNPSGRWNVFLLYQLAQIADFNLPKGLDKITMDINF